MPGNFATLEADEPSVEVIGVDTSYIMRLASSSDAAMMLFSTTGIESASSNTGYWIGTSNTQRPILVVGSNAADTFVIDGTNIGIGTLSPNALLHIYNTSNDNNKDFIHVSSNTFIVSSYGNIGIGTSFPQYKLHCEGDFYAQGNINVYHTSDLRVKENITMVDVHDCFSNIRNIPLRKWNWKTNSNLEEIGWIAQEVERSLPQAVIQKNAFGIDDFKMINYDYMLKNVYGAVQHLINQMDDHDKKLNFLLSHFPQYKNR